MRLHLLSKLENAHDDSLWSVTWAPGSNILATGSTDESVKLWEEVQEGLQQKHILGGASLGAVSVVFDKTGTYGAVSSLDSSVNVWTMENYSQVGGGVRQPPSESWGVTFLPRSDGIVLALAGGMSNTVKVIDVMGDNKELLTMSMPQPDENQRKEQFVLSVACSPDGRKLAAGSMNGTVAIFDADNGGLLHSLKGHFKAVRSLTFTPDSKFLITGCDDCVSHMYDAETGVLVGALSGHQSWILSVSVSPDGFLLATGGSDAKVKLWDLKAQSCIQTVADQTDQIWGVSFRGDGRRLASVSDDRSICLYDVN